MTNVVELFEKFDGKWRPLSLASCTGAAIRHEVWSSMEGKEITGKLTRQQEVIGYIAGTEELREFYRSKANTKVWSWVEAADLMAKSQSALLDDALHQGLVLALKVFGEGCEIVKTEYNQGGNHGQKVS